MIQIKFPYGIDSLVVNITHRAYEIPKAADLPQPVRAYSWTPRAVPTEDGWIWWIYVQPTDNPSLVAELLAHEASHVADALSAEWGGPDALWGESRAYLIQAIVHVSATLYKAMCE